MLGRNQNSATKQEDEDRLPLLNASEEGPVTELFSTDDHGEVAERTGDAQPRRGGPTLTSPTASREVEFELDSYELDEQAASYLQSDSLAQSSHRYLEAGSRLERRSSTPLLVGLVDSAHARQSLDQHHNGAPPDMALEELAKKRVAGGGMLDSIANMANSILGAGIIGLPYAIRQAGFFTGIILLIVLTVVTDWTIRLIVINAKLSGRNSYIGIMEHCYGRSGRAAVSLFQFAFAFGGMCVFGIIIGDTIPHVVQAIFPGLPSIPVLKIFAQRQFIIALCTICVSYPLSLYRDIHKLSRASGFALLGMIIIVVSVLIEREKVSPDLKGDPALRYSIIQPQLAQAIGVISFAFVCHHNSLLIYGSLRTPTLDRFTTVTHVSAAFSLVSCLTLAVSAYVVFTDKIQGNVLNNFASDDTVINIARFCFGLNMFTTLPLELFVCREVIEQYFFEDEDFSPQRHLLFTTSILFSSMFLSMITCDLGIMLEITGGVSATALAFVFPAICYLKLLPNEIPWNCRRKLPAIVCALFGVVVLSLSLIFALAKGWSDEGSARLCTT